MSRNLLILSACYVGAWIVLALVLMRALSAVPTVVLLPLVVGAGLVTWLDAVEAV